MPTYIREKEAGVAGLASAFVSRASSGRRVGPPGFAPVIDKRSDNRPHGILEKRPCQKLRLGRKWDQDGLGAFSGIRFSSG